MTLVLLDLSVVLIQCITLVESLSSDKEVNLPFSAGNYVKIEHYLKRCARIMRSVLEKVYILIGAVAGTLLGFPVADFIRPYLADISRWLIQAIALISLIFVDELSWVSVLDDFYEFLFVAQDSFPELVFYIKYPPLIFYIILILYEIIWPFFYLKWLRDNEHV